MSNLQHIFSRVTMLFAVVVLVSSAACSKSDSGEDKAKVGTVTATDVAGLAKETLLVLKFHHDD